MKKGDVINTEKLGERTWNITELFDAIKNSMKVWSWGAHTWVMKEDMWLRFKAEGHHHKGHVYIILAWNDTFTIIYTTLKGKIVDINTEIYIDMLIDTIDKRIEYINDYKGG